MICDLLDLYKLQEELDLEIAKNHHIDYPTTRNKRTVALLVELGEFANTTRCFKFWSNKGMESKAVVLDEFADGLHFLLSLGIDRGYIESEIEVENDDKSLTDNLLETYELISNFVKDGNLRNYRLMFASYLKMLFKIDCSWKEAKEAYYKKCKINHVRQETNY